MKRAISIVLSLLMVLALLSGCGGTEKPAAPESTAPESTAPESSVPETKWPEKTVNIIVPYSAGGDTDMNARALAEKLAEKTGGTFVVTNIGGNGGATGALEALSSAPDG